MNRLTSTWLAVLLLSVLPASTYASGSVVEVFNRLLWDLRPLFLGGLVGIGVC